MKNKKLTILTLILNLLGLGLFPVILNAQTLANPLSSGTVDPFKTAESSLAPVPQAPKVEDTALINPFAAKLPKKEPTPQPTVQPPTTQPVDPLARPAPQIKPEPPKAPNFRISGVVWNTDRPQAIINNQVVSVGDTIDNSKIVSINKVGIDVISGGQKFSIPY
ncbi:MAG: hypothetical protein A2787_08905 [Omnitrophica WOR_2 bacterium RIFCSPHIGHO2_01_FULL_48_9]|nr:MAG: hypothetical protein A2787_08905 [Omnitrophica WOR_2 bacterium RIFCSPHIGHO2_01_FULL_48_9]